MEFLTVAGGDAWFVAPCLWDRHNRDPHTLLVVPISKITEAGDTLELQKTDVSIVPWPEKEVDIEPTIKSYVQMRTSEGPILWLNTERCGLARFDKTKDGWRGRWYRPADGIPSEITNLAPANAEDNRALFIAGYGFDGRIIDITHQISLRWGEISGAKRREGVQIPVIDGLLSATALGHSFVIVSRNVDDFRRAGVPVFNPWEDAGKG